MAKTLVGLYDTLTDAERIVQELAAQGFSRSDMLLASHQANGRHSHDTDVGEWLSADDSGDVFDRLTDLGVPTHEASSYAEGVRRGGALVVVEASDDLADRGLEIMNRMQPIDIDERAALWRKEGWTGVNANTGPYTSSEMRTSADPNTGPYTASKRDAYATEERVAATAAEKRANATQERVTAAAAGSTAPRQQTHVQGRVDKNEEVAIPVAEEEVTVGKREVERGRVRIHSRVKERPVEEAVRLREERVSVERRRVDRPATDADFNATEETIEVTETAEVPVVNKQARVVEEVVIHKETDEHTETIRDTARRKDVEVDREAVEHTETRRSAARGAVTDAERAEAGRAATATAAMDFSAYDADYRRHHQATFKDLGTYAEYEPAYRYGYALGFDERYRGRNWTELETDFHRDWEVRQPGTWEKFKDAIRYAWEKITGQDTTSHSHPVVVPSPDRPAATGPGTSDHAATRMGGMETTTAGATTDFSAYDADCRRHHGAAFMGRGAYVDYEPAYRYGYDLGMNERYHGRDWPELETDFRRDWEVRQPGTWEKFKDAIRYGWDKVRART